ncbi:MAG: tRNA uridine-5-carboxymethylaminomethyl(34) synthesis GTPase MnmE [Candidatus Omnitrophica bacterium]|nr:tRNA uridine-5-carboxymethylaminomethyl(34) synthesis GTPase MnmE [Candidatus Omnitrophota bacterium]
MKFDLNDTIAAIATATGEAGIGIVRISGGNALSAADNIFLSKDNNKPSQAKGYTLHYGWIIDSRKNIIDEVLLSVMRAPKSFTREDVVEISCHGGLVSLRAVLDLALENGCRLAQPGEFTKRAFLNGRLDLSQAEAVLDIIRAKTDNSLKIGINQLSGILSAQINKIRAGLLEILAILEANIDFPDEQIDPAGLKDISGRLGSIDELLVSLLEGAKRGRVSREGIHTVICGKPNVGKSSLLNALLKQERSIVTPVAGTTRDTIEEIIDIKGIPVRIVDTAGIVEPADLVEKKAIRRSRQHMDLADLVLMVFDGSGKLSGEDHLIMRKLLAKKKEVIAIINKIDARQRIEKEKIEKNFSPVIGISAKKLKNINILEDAIADSVFKGRVFASESVLVSNARHIQLLKKTHMFISGTKKSLASGLSAEFIAQDVKDALGCLDDMLGKRFSEDLLDRIFSEFCIGK